MTHVSLKLPEGAIGWWFHPSKPTGRGTQEGQQ